MALNKNERKVLDVIRQDPYVSQQDLADAVELSRSAVANIISNLVRKGYLLGKAYIVNKERPIVCIGAANIDNRHIVQDDLVGKTSHNIKAASSLGGVARNTAENLGRLSEHVELISVVGNDDDWKRIKNHSKHFIDLTSVSVLEEKSTGNFIEIINKEQELLVGLADMSIYECLTPKLINKYLNVIQRAKCIVVDTNCPKETIEFLLAFTKRYNIKLVLMTVSAQQMGNLPHRLDGATLVTKHNELETAFKRPVQTNADLKEMVLLFLNRGFKEIIISKDSEKIIYGNKNRMRIFENPRPYNKQYDWGQNEAMISGMLYAEFHLDFCEDPVLAGVVNAFKTLDCLEIVRPDLTNDKLQKEVEETTTPITEMKF
ncbi:PfkB family carbohydrate kinase [Desemzia sp. C1]|uniref:PfkB family carbohydrate kinase n=1 Tax=Desemzia sp. C1 TaxID=2892016 RepID=UPI001E35437A|nr:PfkB family carbohydrate kinase [Desemzia sp. C1]MCI3027755.1 PfkB family carbohydrate kinase [Desemzia sp. C1]